jgi:hypothetical protein
MSRMVGGDVSVAGEKEPEWSSRLTDSGMRTVLFWYSVCPATIQHCLDADHQIPRPRIFLRFTIASSRFAAPDDQTRLHIFFVHDFVAMKRA